VRLARDLRTAALLEHVEVSGAAGLNEKVRLLEFMAHLF
jgi:hypothetical protein